MANCVGMGLFSPIFSINGPQTASVAFSPNIALHGSPGIERPNAKVTMRMPSKTGMARTSLRKMNDPIIDFQLHYHFSKSKGGSYDLARPKQIVITNVLKTS